MLVAFIVSFTKRTFLCENKKPIPEAQHSRRSPFQKQNLKLVTTPPQTTNCTNTTYRSSQPQANTAPTAE